MLRSNTDLLHTFLAIRLLVWQFVFWLSVFLFVYLSVSLFANNICSLGQFVLVRNKCANFSAWIQVTWHSSGWMYGFRLRLPPGPSTLIFNSKHCGVPSSGLAAEIPAREENMSGAPLPRAIMVTPATFWDSLESKIMQRCIWLSNGIVRACVGPISPTVFGHYGYPCYF